MKLFGHFGLCLLALGIGTQVWAQEKTFYIEVENPWEQNKPDYPIVLKTADFKCNFPILSATVYDGEKEIPSQTDDLDRDGKGPPKQKRICALSYRVKKQQPIVIRLGYTPT